MHIAQFIQRYPPALGGSEAYARRLSDHLQSRGHTVDVWTTTAHNLKAFWQRTCEGDHFPSSEGIHRFRPRFFPGRRYILKALSLVPIRPWQGWVLPCNPICPEMYWAASRYSGPLDAVHALAFPYAFPILCGLKLARRRGVPFFLTPFLHLGDPDQPSNRTRRQYTQPALRWILQQADCVFVQTRLEWHAVHDLGVPAAKIIYQGLGVDPLECTGGDRPRARAYWQVDDTTCVIGHLANASVEKGTVDLLRAAELAWDHGSDFRIVLAGPAMPNFERYWHGYRHQERVIRLGSITEDQKRDFYAGIDAFALPSRSDSFGLVLLEAWANGKPNIVYRAGGPGELIRAENDGWLVTCGDIPGLARALMHAGSDPAETQRRGTNGAQRIPSEFQWAHKLQIFERELGLTNGTTVIPLSAGRAYSGSGAV